MIDHLFIGPAPCDEDCAQIGITEGASRLNRLECEAYIEALRVVYGDEPNGAYLETKAERHDFGTYREVVCYYDTDNHDAAMYAFKVESGLRTWSEANMTAPVIYDIKSQAVINEEARA